MSRVYGIKVYGIRNKSVSLCLSVSVCSLISLFLIPYTSVAQELNCSVQVLAAPSKEYPELQNATNKKILQSLQQSIFEFMNNRKWTNDAFQQDERIECSIVITVTDKPSADIFGGTILVQMRRPVYKSSYYSLLLNIVEGGKNDKPISFKYIEYQPLEFSESTYMSNLTSVLAFYAYIIIGTDYDSFSPEGGTPYFQKAQSIVLNAQNSPDAGWQSAEDRSRYWIVENVLNSTFKPLRECVYKYHRLGFDMMHENVSAGRTAVLQSLESLKSVHEIKPGSYSMQLFFLAKADEIVNLFSAAEPLEKNKVIELLNAIDPANTIKYSRIVQNND